MFAETYNIVLAATSFDDLKNKLAGIYIDERQEGDSFITVAAQLAIEDKDEKVDWLRQLGASVNAITYGYILTENDQQVEIYREQHNVDVNFIAQCYARAGNDGRVEAYQVKHRASAAAIAQGYAEGGYYDHVEAYRKKYFIDVNFFARIYAFTGAHAQVETYRIDYKANICAIIDGYAQAGNREKQKEYERYAIDALLDDYLEERTKVLDANGKTKEYFYGDFFSSFQKSFTEKSNAVKALRAALNGENVNLNKHLSTLRNGKLGQELRDFIKSGRANHLVDNPVNTVSDFIQALHDKVSNKPQENSFTNS